jgi:hypothetical protein
MSPSTHQGSPKVPEKIFLALLGGEWRQVNPNGQALQNAEVETYIPLSALLSDEVVEAACDRFEQALKREEFDQFEFPESFMREAIQAAIEQVGGSDG